jgi:DNA-binding MurR/RpiR family transcriptional regulator
MTKRSDRLEKASSSCHSAAMVTAPQIRLFERLRVEMDEFTDAERLIANFILTDQHAVPFETAASLAQRLGVSPVTVGRFSRRMGYRNFRELKGALKFDTAATPWASGAHVDQLIAGGRNQSELQRDFELTVAGIGEVYRLARTKAWEAIVDLLVGADEVLVAGFQTERGLAAHFAHTLQYARPGVRIADLSAGNFADVLALEGEGTRVLLIVETRRYSRQAQLLAAQAAADGIDIVFVTDKYCHWARKYTPHVLALSTESAMFWDSMVPIVAALTLLANDAVIRLGSRAEPRLERISRLYQGFTGHIGQRGDKRTER